MSGALLQISDPHFGTEQPPVMRALERLAQVEAPEVVVFSGDITQRATRAQFGAARAFVERLGVRNVLAIPGNHDIPLFQLGARLFGPYERYAEVFGKELEPEFESPDWLVVMVNTTRWYRHEDGEVSRAQIDRVAERLARAAPRQLRVVVTHQPVVVTRPEDESTRLHGREAAVARWSAAGADLVLGGHIHLPFVRPLHGLFADCPRPMWAVQAGTAVSSRVRAGKPNSVNLVRHRMAGDRDTYSDSADVGASRRCTVERWDYSVADDRFMHADSHDLVLAAADAMPAPLLQNQ